ncbi:MAG TPA: efflux RND transporter periplasmic adaptor subunit [Bacteroidales bacterium]|nr:MAG: efflux transporter periplasmic adaptor subunit [Bacteroidetes bacterium GWE2_42_24]OFY31262.1 MAG: efflux transporter periplasmic adaptor subunit [Bacteroidetes bacterium GWF2_43_11]PKP28010.1 MAG: efflux RND transporter periplasmic adaptor subunit [Bacteroidetes bacterium HGW-Bacteroidetes-22]HBZ65643.1 efflux RND transporter periplasmic adaptor subunit [Bacteroidales bacterium]
MKLGKLLFGSIVLLLCTTSCKNKQAEANSADQAKAFPVATLVVQDVELQAVYPAVLKGQQDIDIKARVEGYIDAIYVDEGAVVLKGQPLFKINSPSSVQLIESAKANYNTAKLDVERIRPLAEKGILSQVKLSAYENVLASAKATLDQATAALGWTTVTSPVNGVVGAITFRQGSLATNSTVLTTVSNISNVVAYFSVNEKELLSLLKEFKGDNQAEKIKNMPDVKLLLSDGTEYEESGRIETISGLVDATSGSVSFRALFPNKHGLLRSGSSAKVIIPSEYKEAIVIPQKSTFAQQDKVLVYKFQGDSVVQKVVSVKSTPDGQNYVVTEGLSAGDKIVTAGIVTLTNGQKIKEQK